MTVEGCASSGDCTLLVVETEAGFDALATDWTRLHRTQASGNLFRSWSWNRAWWTHFGSQRQLHIVVVSIAGRVVAIAPFYLSTSSLAKMLRPRTLRLIGRGERTAPDDLDLIADPAELERVSASIVAHLRELDVARLLLEDLDVSSPFSLRLRQEFSGWRHRGLREHEHIRRAGALPATVQEWHASLSRNTRKHLGRRRRAAAREHQISYSLATEPAVIDDAFEHLRRLHLARRRALQEVEPSGFDSADYCDFHRQLMQGLHERGELRLLVLRADADIIGVEYAWCIDGVLSLFQTGFDPDSAHLSPGHLMMSWLIEHAIDDGARRIDLLKGDYDYKRSYVPGEISSVSLDIPRSLIANAAMLALATARVTAGRASAL